MNNLFSSCNERKRKSDVKGNGGKRNNAFDFGWGFLYVLYLFFNVFINIIIIEYEIC